MPTARSLHPQGLRGLPSLAHRSSQACPAQTSTNHRRGRGGELDRRSRIRPGQRICSKHIQDGRRPTREVCPALTGRATSPRRLHRACEATERSHGEIHRRSSFDSLQIRRQIDQALSWKALDQPLATQHSAHFESFATKAFETFFKSAAVSRYGGLKLPRERLINYPFAFTRPKL